MHDHQRSARFDDYSAAYNHSSTHDDGSSDYDRCTFDDCACEFDYFIGSDFYHVYYHAALEYRPPDWRTVLRGIRLPQLRGPVPVRNVLRYAGRRVGNYGWRLARGSRYVLRGAYDLTSRSWQPSRRDALVLRSGRGPDQGSHHAGRHLGWLRPG